MNRRTRERGPEVTSVLLVRHGETTWGVDRRYAGQVDIPLTRRGRRQARQVGRRIAPLRPDVVVSSPLDRCLVTAAAIARAAAPRRAAAPPVTTDPRLTDQSLGEWTGRTEAQICAQWPGEFRSWRTDARASPPGGQSLSDLRTSTEAVVADVVDAHRGGSVVLVSHAAPIRALLTWALGADLDVAYRLRVDNASVSGLLVGPDGEVTVWTINETGHLLG